MAKLTATQTFQSQLEGTDYRIERAGMWFRLWQGEAMVKCCRSTSEMAEFISNMGLAPVGEKLANYDSCPLPPIETLNPENEVVDNNDYHTQHLEAGYCYQTMPIGLVYVCAPDGNIYLASSIEEADQFIREGCWNSGQQCPVEVHFSPIDDYGNQEVVITALTIPVLEADENGIVFMPSYLTEQEYRDSEALMEF